MVCQTEKEWRQNVSTSKPTISVSAIEQPQQV